MTQKIVLTLVITCLAAPLARAQDPSLTSNSFFADRLDALLQAIDAERNARRPGSRRLESRRMSVREGVAISRALLARIEILARS